jgi:hypothetical protein
MKAAHARSRSNTPPPREPSSRSSQSPISTRSRQPERPVTRRASARPEEKEQLTGKASQQQQQRSTRTSRKRRTDELDEHHVTRDSMVDSLLLSFNHMPGGQGQSYPAHPKQPPLYSSFQEYVNLISKGLSSILTDNVTAASLFSIHQALSTTLHDICARAPLPHPYPLSKTSRRTTSSRRVTPLTTNHLLADTALILQEVHRVHKAQRLLRDRARTLPTGPCVNNRHILQRRGHQDRKRSNQIWVYQKDGIPDEVGAILSYSAHTVRKVRDGGLVHLTQSERAVHHHRYLVTGRIMQT